MDSCRSTLQGGRQVPSKRCGRSLSPPRRIVVNFPRKTFRSSQRHNGIVSRSGEEAHCSADNRSKPFQSTYYDARMRASPALLRARAPYLLKNTITGFAICSLVIGICKTLATTRCPKHVLTAGRHIHHQRHFPGRIRRRYCTRRAHRTIAAARRHNSCGSASCRCAKVGAELKD